MNSTFADLGVSEVLCAALAADGITHPFPVQAQAIPVIFDEGDLVAQAPTGSGKTLAFGLPILDFLEPDGTLGALILAPTRELAAQIHGELQPLAALNGLKAACAYGGVPIAPQLKKVTGADVLVATPGRLLDLIAQRAIDVRRLEVLVLDEADRMLDMGFAPQIERIVRELPDSRQTLLFSATFDPEIQALVNRLTTSPGLIEIDDLPDGQVEALSERLEHLFIPVEHAERRRVVEDLIKDEEGLVLVFARTRHGCQNLADRLKKDGVSATAIHGDLPQKHRERALRDFDAGTVRVLVATDVASRGIDLDDISLVVNFDPPDSWDTYTHRAGRTARAGRSGRCATLVMPDQTDEVGRMAKRLELMDAWYASGMREPIGRQMYRSRGTRALPAVSGPAKTVESAPLPVRTGSRVPRRKPQTA